MPNKNVIAIHNEIYPNRFVGYANRDIWGIKVRVEDFTEGWKNFDSPANENAILLMEGLGSGSMRSQTCSPDWTTRATTC